jgi:hypothetical protein
VKTADALQLRRPTDLGDDDGFDFLDDLNYDDVYTELKTR